MTDNELVLAISGLLDKKLKAELQPVKDELRSVKEELYSFKTKLDSFKAELDSFKAELDSFKTKLDSFKAELDTIKLFQENVLLPRLNTIESCYTDTYKRYRDDSYKMETVFDDVNLLKIVVSEHSDKLQMIS